MPEFRLSCYAWVRNRRGEILVLRRSSEKRRFAGQWELPGGKLEEGETLAAATHREVGEEAGIAIILRGLAGAVELALDKYRVILLIFEATTAARKVTLSHEHQDWRWVRLKDIEAMNITPPLRRFLRNYRGGAGRSAGREGRRR